MNEIIAHEWTTLKNLWEGCEQSCADERIRNEANEIFSVATTDEAIGKSGPDEWLKLNRAEQLVGRCLGEIQLGTEFQNLMVLAEDRKISSLEVHRNNATLFSGEKTNADQLERKRSAYLALLYALQSGFVEQRYRRRGRKISARSLAYYGGGLLIGLAILIALLLGTNAWQDGFREQNYLAWIAVIVFGLLGAYFSRLLQFQATLKAISVDDVTQLPVSWSLLLRLGSGMIGAIVLYLLLCAGLVRGDFFPNMGNMGVAAMTEWSIKITGSVAQLESGQILKGITTASPAIEEAKLFVWSFIAGFSERLIPSTLESTENRARG